MQKNLYFAIVSISLIILWGCQPPATQRMASVGKTAAANALISESSPYLLQYAYNPINWLPWGNQALKQAKESGKPLLISIGYASCHWCHTMEKETFTDREVAQFMNDNFICVKVDREERPDIDQIYMEACQLLTGKGGWPLHAIAMPDGRPFFAGTYFDKEGWLKVLKRINKLYQEDRPKLESIAEQLTAGIVQKDLLPINSASVLLDQQLPKRALEIWKRDFDRVNGGDLGSPKFPMPSQLQSLMAQYHFTQDLSVLAHVKNSLDQIASGAIYDHIGGGFFRYCTDTSWQSPHFEKMLYDNAQLISTYTKAYQITKKAEYRIVVYQTIEFILREMQSKQGSFFASLDADSEGQEGKFYRWDSETINRSLKEDAEIFKTFFGIGQAGNMEAPLTQVKSNDWLAKELRVAPSDARAQLESWKNSLLKERKRRVPPKVDQKQLTAWNALAVKALAEAYNVFQEPRFLKASIQTADFIKNNLMAENHSLSRYHINGKAYGQGFMDDYAFSIQAFLGLYETTFDIKWLTLAQHLEAYARQHFQDAKSGYFYYASDFNFQLISRKIDLTDYVIPSSNAIMAQNLWRMGHVLGDQAMLDKSRAVLSGIRDEMMENPKLYAQWWELYLYQAFPFYEVAIVGGQVNEQAKQLATHYLPQKIMIGDKDGKSLPILNGKYKSGQTMIYVCEEGSCKRPVAQLSEALKQLILH